MKPSATGLKLITRWEGVYLRPYNDPVGYCTVGVGHLIAYRRCTAGDYSKWTLADRDAAMKLLARDLEADYAPQVTRLVKVPITQAMFDSLLSFAYNVGVGGLGGSTLLRKLNAGDYKGAAGQFGVWVKAGGQTFQGLVDRRADEARQFLSQSLDPLTSTERRLVNELLKLRRKNRGRKWDVSQRKRANEIKRWIKRQRDRIKAEAKRSGWDTANRQARYRMLGSVL